MQIKSATVKRLSVVNGQLEMIRSHLWKHRLAWTPEGLESFSAAIDRLARRHFDPGFVPKNPPRGKRRRAP